LNCLRTPVPLVIINEDEDSPVISPLIPFSPMFSVLFPSCMCPDVRVSRLVTVVSIPLKGAPNCRSLELSMVKLKNFISSAPAPDMN